MKTQEEIRREIARLNGVRNQDESGVTVRVLTLIALEWALGLNPVSPADRLIEVGEEMAFDGVIDIGGHNDEQGDGAA